MTPYAKLDEQARRAADSSDWMVRANAAIRRDGLDKLAGDPHPLVRLMVAYQGFALDELAEDDDILVSQRARLMKKHIHDRKGEKTMPERSTASDEAQGQQKFARMKFPPGFAHPYTMTAKDGREFDKAIVNIPDGTKTNGIDLSGYSLDIFLNSAQKGRIASGEGIVYAAPADKKIELFKGEGERRETLSVGPWALASALKEQRESYAARKAAERTAAQEKDENCSLDSEAQDMSRAKDGLAAGDALNRKKTPER